MNTDEEDKEEHEDEEYKEREGRGQSDGDGESDRTQESRLNRAAVIAGQANDSLDSTSRYCMWATG